MMFTGHHSPHIIGYKHSALPSTSLTVFLHRFYKTRLHLSFYSADAHHMDIFVPLGVVSIHIYATMQHKNSLQGAFHAFSLAIALNIKDINVLILPLPAYSLLGMLNLMNSCSHSLVHPLKPQRRCSCYLVSLMQNMVMLLPHHP